MFVQRRRVKPSATPSPSPSPSHSPSPSPPPPNSPPLFIGGARSDTGSEDPISHGAGENVSDIDMQDHEGQSQSQSQSQLQMLDHIAIPTLKDLGRCQSDYESFSEERRVQRLLREVARGDGLWYKTVFVDGHTELVSFEQLLSLSGGPEALEGLGTDPGAALINLQSPNRRKQTSPEQEQENNNDDDEDPISTKTSSVPPSDRELRRRRIASLAQNRKAAAQRSASPSEDELASPAQGPAARRTRSQPMKKISMLPYKGQPAAAVQYDSDDDLVVSDLVYTNKKKKKRHAPVSTRTSSRARAQKRKQYDSGSEFSEEETTRRSGRTAGKRNTYTEPGIDDDFMDIDSYLPKPTRPRVIHSKEIFPPLDESNRFVTHHNQYCETCGDTGSSRHRGHLVYCQGCSCSYHVECIGSRSAREHLVTKTADDDFVLQCKRCIGVPRRKDQTAPHTQNCQDCREPGKACTPFRTIGGKKKPDGSAPGTPDVEVDPDLLYNPDHVLFRCTDCHRAWHWEHLPDDDDGRDLTPEQRRAEYEGEFKCLTCLTYTRKIQTIRAWRPARGVEGGVEVDIRDYEEDDREYLIKFTGLSYFRSEWLPGAWVWGTNSQMRSNFVKKSPLFAVSTEQAVPESMLRVEIVYDVRYTSIVPTGEDRAVDIARIGEVTEAYVKWQGGEGGDVVWEVPPQEPKKGSRKGKGKQKVGGGGEDDEDEDAEVENQRGRWEDWKKAYEDFVHGKFIRLPRSTLKRREMVKGKAFKGLEKKEQPPYIVGGQLMKYQIDGMNWLYYKWHEGQTSILADEMGLGKTIQIISYLSIMVNDLALYPFLIVVPHSTVPNWKREIQTWAPSMRVVAYFGSAESRALSRKYELFHPGTRDLKCHIVVTSYSTPITDSQYLKGIPWEALIVDEGQRLKNDESLLYKSLEGYKIKHKVLMTGTPLQNNPRELFNLLHFLDPEMDAGELEREYGELTGENVKRLHEMIRPFFLRRTKKEVLTFLPPMAEVIVPVTMSSLQRKLYKSILAQDPVLIKSIFKNPGDKSKSGSLKNVLMQLRKVLGHPFFYSDGIEDRTFDQETLHRNLIEAGGKFELLNIMLPKLKERGHRVLMFSQFLGMLDVMEDFLVGLGMSYQRLDGGTNTQEKQRRIDAYNRPGSKDFAFLLSTRAGGVGINLATADTVIILDPDFNPHQDIQALSRAHRIGQKNKVLVFHLVTRDTAEEKIMQIGKKKLSLDHLIIEKMGAEGDGDEQVDVESVLKFGARALFEDEGALEERRIKYDSEGVDRLLDRSTIEETKTTEVAGAENAFSFARVWANDKGSLEEGGLGGDDTSEGDMDVGFWDKLLAEREEQARIAAAAVAQELGRGKRRKKVDYSLPNDEFPDSSPKKPTGSVRSRSADDDDFRAEEEPESESDGEMGGVDMGDGLDGLDLQRRIAQYQDKEFSKKYGGSGSGSGTGSGYPQGKFALVAPVVYMPSVHQVAPVAPMAPMGYMDPSIPPPVKYLPAPLPRPKQKLNKKVVDRTFRRVDIIPIENVPGQTHKCRACSKRHAPGQCKLKKMGVEFCPLCGIAHYGKATACAHLQSEGNLTSMLQALKQSKEDPQLVKEAKAYVTGRKAGVKRARKANAEAQMSATNHNERSD